MSQAPADVPTTASLLQLLHPLGRVETVRVFGRACGVQHPLCPAGMRTTTGRADLVILAPSAQELAAPGWLEQTLPEAAAALHRDGLLYVLAHRKSRRVTDALLKRSGLAVVETVLHHPGWADAQTLVPLKRPTLAYAFSRLIRTHPTRRAVALALLRVPGVLALVQRLLPTVGLLAQRPDTAAPLAWFAGALHSGSAVKGVVMNSSWRGREGAVLLHAVGNGSSALLAVAKTWFGANGEAAVAEEAGGLGEVAAGAAGLGVAVPALLRRGHLGRQPYLVETAVAGERAATWLQRRPAQLPALLARLTEWLGAWQATKAQPQVLTRAALDLYLLQPAAELAPALGADEGALARLHALASCLEGATLPLTPAHGDLTMVNVLVERAPGPGRFRLGVIDWETARPAWLPLADFFYMAVDAVAATAAYQDRPAAFADCFGPGGRYRSLVGRLQEQLTVQMGLTPDHVALCFQATWLSHALAERQERAKAAPDEFLQIARLAVAPMSPADAEPAPTPATAKWATRMPLQE